MIRELQNSDINSVTDLWLDTNLKAHDFIPSKLYPNGIIPKKIY